MNCKGRNADEESASERDIIGQSQKGEKCILSKKKKKFIIIVHSWCGGHFTSINTCGVWKAMTGDQVSREEIHTHIHLD